MDIAKIRKKAAQAGKTAKPSTHKPSDTETETLKTTEEKTENTKPVIKEGPAESGEKASPEESIGVETPEVRIDLLCFQLGPETYAFHMRDVQEIAHPPAITPVPGTPSYVKGLSSLRGKMVPIVDLKARLNITDTEKIPDTDRNRNRVTQRAKIVIVRGPRGPIGVMADRIVGVRRMPESDLNPAPPHITEEEARFIEGIIISDGIFMTILRTEEALGLTITKKAHPQGNQ
ncbi:MAG: chemotaxis protein CheW [Nitrospirota bacterium]|nr:chemotaxis protein CheW [Nitrospirota bacterium]